MLLSSAKVAKVADVGLARFMPADYLSCAAAVGTFAWAVSHADPRQSSLVPGSMMPGTLTATSAHAWCLKVGPQVHRAGSSHQALARRSKVPRASRYKDIAASNPGFCAAAAGARGADGCQVQQQGRHFQPGRHPVGAHHRGGAAPWPHAPPQVGHTGYVSSSFQVAGSIPAVLQGHST